MPPGYAVILVAVDDAKLYAEYARHATEIEARHGGRPLIVADAAEVVDGTWPSERVVVLEFPSIEHARAWYADPDYRDLILLRQRATRSQVLLVEGFTIPGNENAP
jgi:uncharacterized protein (DUF1330 family)